MNQVTQVFIKNREKKGNRKESCKRIRSQVYMKRLFSWVRKDLVKIKRELKKMINQAIKAGWVTL
jgi:hypothetical protein